MSLTRLSSGTPVVYRHAEGDRPATYLGRYGARHIITIAVHGAYGRGLRYVEDGAIKPVIPTASNP
jgi:hypothetical protein